MNESRKNNVLSAVVERGIWLSAVEGSAVAWVYMQAFEVPKEAIARVLAYPHARRLLSTPMPAPLL
jgi:hypothetical protein